MRDIGGWGLIAALGVASLAMSTPYSDFDDRPRRRKPGFIVGVGITLLAIGAVSALSGLFWATEARAHDAIPTALWAKRGEA